MPADVAPRAMNRATAEEVDLARYSFCAAPTRNVVLRYRTIA